MRLIPPTIPPDTPSDGEKLVFELLAADSAHDDWTILHSLDVAHHRRQQQGEIDFACIVPGRGVLCLEIKGCHRLSRSRGVWYYGADTEGDPRGPFKQASEAMHSLRNRLVRRRRHLKRIPFQSAVCFPFLDFTETSEEWHDWQVIDRRGLDGRPIADLIAAVLDRARERTAELRLPWFDPEAGEPTPAQCDDIVKALRGDFEFYESPKARARRLDEEIRRFTEEQFAVLDQFARNPRVIVDGSAGTGKTLLAVEQARRSASAGRRVLLLCFNRALAKWLAEEAGGDGMSGGSGEREGNGRAGKTTVLTIHEYMRRVSGVEFTEEQLGASIVPGGGEAFDELILDEGQDMLRESYLDVLELSLAGGFAEGRYRIFGDFAHQAIFDAADLTFEDLQRRCPTAFIADLAVNCRNTPRVLALARGVDVEESGRISRPDDGVDPIVRFYRDPEHQCDLLGEALEQLRDEGFTGPQVVVLSPHNDQACAAAGFCGLAGAWRDRLAPLVPTGQHEPDLRSGKTKYASIYRFKGLESRAVVLTDIDRLPRTSATSSTSARRARRSG